MGSVLGASLPEESSLVEETDCKRHAGRSATAVIVAEPLDDQDDDERSTDCPPFASSSNSLSDPDSLPEVGKFDEVLHTDFCRRVTAPAVLQVAEWQLDQDMEVLHASSSSCLTNSKVWRTLARSTSTDLASEADVAVKSVSFSEDDCSIAMLRRECSFLQELGNCHPHILPMLAFTEIETELMMVTKLAPDGDLSRLAPAGSCLEEVQVQRLDKQLLSALAYLQDMRMVHGDLKPQNVFLTEVEGRLLAQLADFGLSAKVPAGEAWIELEQVQGSYGFVAAEVKHQKRLSFAADLFALGVITFRLLSSYDPFYPASAVESELLFDAECWEPLTAESKALVEALLAPQPELRGSAPELLKGNRWLTTDETFFARAGPRSSAAPRPLQICGFHSLEASARLWSAMRQSCFVASKAQQ
eukprot:TRINITY_DN106546_c0_g1_i1.p1 TRINITY_DN106546_c0_g1~~TRINITY_DN106546_c0_g1_i1.p1  ORF type:complete len:416 (+),score=95.06 TRINITY_DN106546_c0_g1_i1:72-1319(+)